MPGTDLVYRFGPFELDAGRRRLTNGDRPVGLPDRQLDVLLALIDRAGEIVSKDVLTEVAWHGLAVTDNSLVQAVRGLRKALDLRPGGIAWIETFSGEGYRFVVGSAGHAVGAGQATRAAGAEPATAVLMNALLEPYRPFMDGRAAIESFDRDAIARARQAFRDVIARKPDLAAAHIGLANACLLGFEATRIDPEPDRQALELAEFHAREGCRLDRSSGDAWGTLAMVCRRRGAASDTMAAARRAIALEPEEWRHSLRLADVSWGVDRLRATSRVLSLCPGLALAHWFAATVFVARGLYDMALDHLRAACAAAGPAMDPRKPFTAVGLYWLMGLILLAQGDEAAALGAWERELALDVPGHVYRRECCANTYYAIGALRLRQGRQAEACAAFEQALSCVPGHALSAIGLAAASGRASGGASVVPSTGATLSDAVHLAIGRAVGLVLRGEHAAAAQLCDEALTAAGPGSSGWLLPVEPLLNVGAHPDAWAAALATLRARAV